MFKELNEGGSNLTWASISNGMIVVKSDESDPKAKSRVNKLGNTVWERYYRSIYGVITSIEVEENKFGEKDIKVGIQHESNTAILTIKAESSYGRSFYAQIFNADLTRGIEFTPWQKITEDGTKKTRLYLGYSKGQNVEWKLPNGTPEVIFVEVKGKKVVDNISQIKATDFLEEALTNFAKANGLDRSLQSQNIDQLMEPLTDEEKKQLSKPKSSTKGVKSNITMEESSSDDFFDSLDD
jgi:hypothetical protein